MDPIQDTFYYSTALARYVLSGSPLLFTDRCATITLNVIYAKGIIVIVLQYLHSHPDVLWAPCSGFSRYNRSILRLYGRIGVSTPLSTY